MTPTAAALNTQQAIIAGCRVETFTGATTSEALAKAAGASRAYARDGWVFEGATPGGVPGAREVTVTWRLQK
jgi:hypothetical protein